MTNLHKLLAQMRLWLKSLIAPPTPYWRDALEDHQGSAGATFGLLLGQQIFFVIVVGLIVLLPSAYLAAIVFAHPGGVADVIGSQLAQVCRTTGNCDLNYLLAGYAFALIFLFVAIAMISRSVSLYTATTEEEPDIRDDLASLDNRICALRDDLVASGILQAERGEQPDGD